jgi:hypothetical protein
MPSDVPDWANRRDRIRRAPPRPTAALGFQQPLEEGEPSILPPYENDAELYELDAGVSVASGANGDSVPRTVPPNEIREYYGQQDGVQNDEDEELRSALAMSQHGEPLAVRPTNTGGFDEDEIAEAMNRSMHVK